jgi:hypothetical protein
MTLGANLPQPLTGMSGHEMVRPCSRPILERSRSNGHDIGPTGQVLRNMRELNRVYDDYRQSIADGLSRSPLR